MSLILPSYQSGFAPRDYEPAYPSLWQGCVGAWAPLLGPTGLVLRDSVGKNDGVLTNGPTWDISGGRYALGFDGVDDVVTGSLPNAVNIASVSFWLKPTATLNSSSAASVILQFKGGSGLFWIISGGNSTSLLTGEYLTVLDDNDYRAGITDGGSISSWTHIGIRWNGANYEFYKNGIPATASTTGPARLGTTNTAGFRIGGREGSIQFYSGQVDDVRIYSKVLSPNEIALLASRRGIACEPKRTRKWYFRGFSPKKKLLEAKITSTVPGSYQTGYAPRDGEPVYPELWKGCVGAWSAGLGPSGLTLRDNSPAENHGTLVGGPTYQVSGGQYALGFDGSDDRVSVPTSTTYDISSIKTISAWINGSSFDGAFSATDIIAKDTIATRDWAFMAYDTNANANNATISFSAYGTGGGYLWRRTSSEVLAVGGWNHVAFTYDGALNTNEMRLYLNGVEQASSDFSSGTYGSHKSTSNALLIGLRGGIDSHWNGALDDIRLYNRILSPNEIALLATRRGIGYDYKTHRSYSKTQSSGLLKRLLLTGQT